MVDRKVKKKKNSFTKAFHVVYASFHVCHTFSRSHCAVKKIKPNDLCGRIVLNIEFVCSLNWCNYKTHQKVGNSALWGFLLLQYIYCFWYIWFFFHFHFLRNYGKYLFYDSIAGLVIFKNGMADFQSHYITAKSSLSIFIKGG